MAQSVAAAGIWPAELVALYREQLVGYAQLAYLVVGPTAMADEIVQDAFLAVRQRWDRVRTSPGGYVRQAVVNGARARVGGDGWKNGMPGTHPPGAPAELVELRDALSRLPLPQRAAIVLRFWAACPTRRRLPSSAVA